MENNEKQIGTNSDNGQISQEEFDVNSLNTLDEIEAKLTELDNVVLQEETPDEDKVDTIKDVDEKLKEMESPEKKAPEQTDKAITDKQNNNLLITDEVISKFPPEDQKILTNFKGKTIEDALKSFVHAQRLVGKRQEQQPYTPKTETEKNEIEQVKDNLLLQRMKAKYNDFPENEEQWADLNYDNPRKAFMYMNEEVTEKKRIEQDVSDYMQVKTTYPQINETRIKAEIDNIRTEVEKLGLKLDEVGVDLSYKEDNELLNNLLTDASGTNFDPYVVDMVGFGEHRFPLINEVNFRRKILDVLMPKIIENAKAKARSEGYNQAHNKGKPAPSLSSSSFKGVQKQPDVLTDSEIANLDNLDRVQELIDRF